MIRRRTDEFKSKTYYLRNNFVRSLVCTVLLSFAIVLQSTILNPSYIMDNMNASNYFVDKRDEIKESLVDLGFASGLDEKFLKMLLTK